VIERRADLASLRRAVAEAAAQLRRRRAEVPAR